MFSAQTMPIAEPTCASISLPVTSPMAQMPGTLVCMRLIDLDETALADLDTHFFQSQSF